MSRENYPNVGVVILAAGKGTRLNCTDKPKVMSEIGGKPIVSYIVDTLREVGFIKGQIMVVVGFQKETVKQYFGDSVTYIDQTPQLGTAQAAYIGMKALPIEAESVLILGGDDSAFYTAATISEFIKKHVTSRSILSLLTVEVADPTLLGRVIRDERGQLISVLEKEQLTPAQATINEVSTGTYGVNRQWYEATFPTMTIIPGLNEYGLNKVVEIGQREEAKIQAVRLANPGEWFSINTPEELAEADRRKFNTI